MFAALCVCVGEIIPLPWFSKELKNDLSKNNYLRDVILILFVRESIFVGWGFSFAIVLVPRYKLSLCHTPIKPDLLGFPGIGVFACGLRDHVITRFTSLEVLYEHFYWPNMKRDVQRMCDRCITCRQAKFRVMPHGLYTSLLVLKEPWVDISMDVILGLGL